MDRNYSLSPDIRADVYVALRKESVDRNCEGVFLLRKITIVALRKESVDRNFIHLKHS